ncbi:MAG TPA: hypothetical protein VGE72_16135 [Azospirillum sp.]
MELNWKVDFARKVAISEAASVAFHERAPDDYAVMEVRLSGRTSGQTRIGLSHDALKAIRAAALDKRRRGR